MSGKKHDDTEGVAVRLDAAPDHREAGVPVSLPADDSAQEPKSGQSAASTKEK